VKEEYGELSLIARQGSGSAYRSMYGGFVKWCMGKKDDGSDSIAVLLADEAHWKDLIIIIAVICVYLIYIPHDLLHILLIVMWLQ